MQYVVIDRRQAEWAILKAVERINGAKLPAGLANLLLSVFTSPGASFPAANVVYLRGYIPEYLLEYVIDHEVLHCVIYRAYLDGKKVTPKIHQKAHKATGIIDAKFMHKLLTQVWGLDYKQLEYWIQMFILKSYGPYAIFRKLRKLIGRVKLAFQGTDSRGI